jgi:hypothetical protein
LQGRQHPQQRKAGEIGKREKGRRKKMVTTSKITAMDGRGS